MKKIQTWNKKAWVDTNIEDIPPGAHIIRIVLVEEEEKDAKVHVGSNEKQQDAKV